MNQNNKIKIYLMILVIVISLIVLVIVCFSFYHRVLYPLLQFFKKRNEDGYILTKENKFEHRAFIEKLMGRRLNPDEEVHHINGKKWDNRKKNLALMTSYEHLRWHKKLDWMYSKKKFPSIKLQRRMLEEDFGAELF